jgi:hypothetical protein
MEPPDRIASSEELDAWLEQLREVGGTPDEATGLQTAFWTPSDRRL